MANETSHFRRAMILPPIALGLNDLVASVAITGPETLPELKAYAEDVKERMLRFGGVPKVTVKGFSEHQIRIEVSDDMLRQFGLSLADVAGAIGRQSIDLPAGNIETVDGNLLLRFAEERTRVNKFADLVVVSETGGGQVRLGDIARIEDRFELEEQKVFFNGRPAALLKITKTENEDTAQCYYGGQGLPERGARKGAAECHADGHQRCRVYRRRPAEHADRKFLAGLLLVFLAMWAVFGWRYSFWIVMELPVAFMGAFAFMVMAGFSINMPSMLGFVALAGVVVNDSILLVQHIKRHHAPGISVAELAPKASRARFRAILLTSLTTIPGLLPLMSEISLQAQVLVPLVTSLAFGLMASTVLVLLVVPAIYAILDDFGLSTLAEVGERDEADEADAIVRDGKPA